MSKRTALTRIPHCTFVSAILRGTSEPHMKHLRLHYSQALANVASINKAYLLLIQHKETHLKHLVSLEQKHLVRCTQKEWQHDNVKKAVPWFISFRQQSEQKPQC